MTGCAPHSARMRSGSAAFWRGSPRESPRSTASSLSWRSRHPARMRESVPAASRCCCSIRIGPAGIISSSGAGWPRLGRALSEALSGALGPYALQAAIAACHARALTRRRHRLDAHLRTLRRTGADRAIAGRGAQPGSRLVDGVRPGRRPRSRRCAAIGAAATAVSSAAERPWRSARETRAIQRSARGVRTRGITHPERPREGATDATRRHLPQGRHTVVTRAQPSGL